MVRFGEFLKTWSLRSNSVTRQVNFNRTKIGRKCQNGKTKWDIWVIFKEFGPFLTKPQIKNCRYRIRNECTKKRKAWSQKILHQSGPLHVSLWLITKTWKFIAAALNYYCYHFFLLFKSRATLCCPLLKRIWVIMQRTSSKKSKKSIRL